MQTPIGVGRWITSLSVTGSSEISSRRRAWDGHSSISSIALGRLPPVVYGVAIPCQAASTSFSRGEADSHQRWCDVKTWPQADSSRIHSMQTLLESALDLHQLLLHRNISLPWSTAGIDVGSFVAPIPRGAQSPKLWGCVSSWAWHCLESGASGMQSRGAAGNRMGCSRSLLLEKSSIVGRLHR